MSFNGVYKTIFLELLRLTDLGQEIGFGQLRILFHQIVASHVSVVLSPNRAVKGLRVLGIVVIAGGSRRGILRRNALEPEIHSHAVLGDVIRLVRLLQLRLHDRDGDEHRGHPARHLLGRVPLALVTREGLDLAALPVDVIFREVEFPAQVRVLLVISQDPVGEHAAVPEGHDDPSLQAGHHAHLVDDRVADLLGHDHDGVVGADQKGGLVLLVVPHGDPPLVQLHGIRHVELDVLRVALVGLPAVRDEVGVDVHADAGLAGALQVADDLAGAAAHFHDDVVAVLLAGLEEAAAGVDVEVVEDGLLAHDGVFPGVDGELGPQLRFVVLHGALVVERLGVDVFCWEGSGRVGSHGEVIVFVLVVFVFFGSYRVLLNLCEIARSKIKGLY
mmetsp:Transcript_11342/g.22694  ORF Transcript_11342/g.22694 Transcript_11342/m.22694 type:complete len:388 (+) Transcript_11342:305-1468(+)